MLSPLVSVMMPYYNTSRTLPWALGSLVAQTHANWECLLVDDGSTDRPDEVVERLGDPRVKLFRLERNQGRGAARRRALAEAGGELLCMVDADDWIYPRKIERQVEILSAEPTVDLVGAAMAVVDAGNALVGVRCRGPLGPPRPIEASDRLAPPSVSFPASMVRTAAARRIGFNSRWPACEDLDFLARLLLKSAHVALPEVHYVYSEYATASAEKLVTNIRLCRGVFAGFRDTHPLASRRLELSFALKELAYRAAFATGQGRRLVERRSGAPTEAEAVEFTEARRTVADCVAQHFPAETGVLCR